MKTLNFILLIVTGLLFVSCKKYSHTANVTLTGKWKLTESLLDPGDGSGKWQPVLASAVSV